MTGDLLPRAEKAIETGDAKEAIEFLLHTVKHELQERFEKAMSKKNYDENDVTDAREFVQANLGFVLWSHGLYSFVKGGGGHGEESGGGHED